MKNDSFFNWLIIIVALLLSIGMFSKSLAYWWVPYLVSLVALARYTDFLESKERDEAVVSFPTKKWSDEITPSNYHMVALEWAKVEKDALELEKEVDDLKKWVNCSKTEDCQMYGCQCDE